MPDSSATPRTVAHQPLGSPVHGFSRQGYWEWVAMPSSRVSSPPRDQTWDSCIGRCVLYLWHHMGSPLLFPIRPQMVNCAIWDGWMRMRWLKVWGNGEWWSLWKDGEGNAGGCKQKWRLWFAPGKGDGNHSCCLGAWGRDRFCFGLNFLKLLFPLSVWQQHDQGPGDPVLGSRPWRSSPHHWLSLFPHLYPKGIFFAFLGSQFSHQKYSRWSYSVVSFVPLNHFFQSLRFCEGKWIAQKKIKKWKGKESGSTNWTKSMFKLYLF